MKEKIIDFCLFIGGTFLSVLSLAGGYYSRGGRDMFMGYNTSSGFKDWSIITLAIGISMIAFGFLRRSWRKK